MPIGGRQRFEWALLGVGIALWTVGDLYTTYLALGAGAIEANPAGRTLLTTYGFGGATISKVAVTGLIVVHWLMCTRGAAWFEATPDFDRQSAWVQTLTRYASFVHPVGLCLLGGALTAWNALVYVSLQ